MHVIPLGELAVDAHSHRVGPGKDHPTDPLHRSISACPIPEPDPVTKSTAPSGKPASWKHSASKRTLQGVRPAGLITTVLPAADARATGLAG